MEPTLKGAYAKHDRAVDHLRDLLHKFIDFAKEHVEVEDQPPRREGSTRYVQIVVKDPTRLGLLEPIVGDCVQNLRSALDYLVYELGITALRQEPKTRTQFPIATSATNYWRTGRHQVRPLLGPHRRAIRKLQPYQGNDPARNRLALLNRLSNQDKHRLLTILVGHVRGFSTWPFKERHGRGEVWPLLFKKQLDVGHIKVKPDVSVVAWATLEFQEEGGLPVIETLADLAEYVKVILDWFEPVVR